jgi:feruloyl esterase
MGLMTPAAIILFAGLVTSASATAYKNCEALSPASLLANDPTAKIDRAIWHEQTQTIQTAIAPGVSVPVQIKSHCEIIGRLQQRIGVNNQAYKIRFHLRLPAQWNGRFVFQGGSGSNGDIGDALGHVRDEGEVALNEGYAVVSQDSGHDNATNSDPAFNGQVAFGFDPQARENYGHKSLKIVTDAAKALVTNYYGRRPSHSYFVGCSKGGQEGMTLATLYPDEFDGIIAGAPGFSLPRAALAEAWDVQSLAPLVDGGDPAAFNPMTLFKAYSAGDLSLVRKAILSACDDLDGLADGIVGDIYHCGDAKVLPRLAAATCDGEKTDNCLSPQQVAVLVRVMHGAVNSAGKVLYATWFWPSGIEGEDWRLWKMGTSDGRVPAFNIILGGGSLASVFTTPPTRLDPGQKSLASYLLAFDFDRDASKIYAVSPPYKTSSWDDVGSRSPDIGVFLKRGGKLIIPHGESDPVFSLKDTLAWYDEVQRRYSHIADSVRVFPVPGMCHCYGGQATNRYDAFTSLVRWVEAGKAPDVLIGTAGKTSPWPGRERPLCPYPLVARYDGKGDTEKAASFMCKA